jgi:hypothetical protein
VWEVADRQFCTGLRYKQTSWTALDTSFPMQVQWVECMKRGVSYGRFGVGDALARDLEASIVNSACGSGLSQTTIPELARGNKKAVLSRRARGKASRCGPRGPSTPLRLPSSPRPWGLCC